MLTVNHVFGERVETYPAPHGVSFDRQTTTRSAGSSDDIDGPVLHILPKQTNEPVGTAMLRTIHGGTAYVMNENGVTIATHSLNAPLR